MGNIFKRITDRSLFAILLFIGFLTCVYAPYELYLLNRQEFWFLFVTFFSIPLLVFLVLFITGYLIGIMLPSGPRIIYKAFLFSLSVCIYIQGNFLNIKGIGVLNGDSVDWTVYHGAMIRDLIIWLITMTVLVCLGIFRPGSADRIFGGISLFMTAVLVASLAFLIIKDRADVLAPNKEVDYLSEEGEYEISSADGNIVVFLLDMFDDVYMKQMVDEDYYLLDSYDGFTYFDNYTGHYSSTVYSLASFFTGREFLNECDFYEWVDSFESDRLYLDELAGHGYELSFFADDVSDIIPDKYYRNAANLEHGRQSISNKIHFTYCLYKLVACKYFPDIVKPYVWLFGDEFDYSKSYDNGIPPSPKENRQFYTQMGSGGIKVTDSDGPEFKFIYLWGTHYPYTINSNVDEVEPNYDGGADCAKGCMKIVAEYIDYLKYAGAYDNTAIVVMGDHGVYWGDVMSNPALLIKPAGERGPLRINNAPVGQMDLAPTILSLAGLDPAAFENEDSMPVFEVPEGIDRERYFYQYYLTDGLSDHHTYRLIEYRMSDSTGNDPSCFELTDNEYTVHGRKIKHSDFCLTCQGLTDQPPREPGSAYVPVHIPSDDYPSD